MPWQRAPAAPATIGAARRSPPPAAAGRRGRLTATDYLGLLAEEAERHGLGVEGYCLSNHVHLIVTPRSEAALAKALGRTHYRYAQYINRMHGRSGHLWQNRLYSCALDDERY